MEVLITVAILVAFGFAIYRAGKSAGSRSGYLIVRPGRMISICAFVDSGCRSWAGR